MKSDLLGAAFGFIGFLALFGYATPQCINYGSPCTGGEFFFKFYINLLKVVVPGALVIYLIHLSMKYLGGGSNE